MDAIVLVDKNWGIGYDDQLLVRIKRDMQRFRELTEGHTVVLGRKSLMTFPGGKALENRRNIVLSRNPNFEAEDVCVFHDLESTIDYIRHLEANGEKVFLIGGESIYKQFLPYCEYAEVTELDKAFDDVDVYFPRLDSHIDWEEVSRSETLEANPKNPYTYHFVRYKNKNVLF